jgi:hypothetical protein
LVAGEVGFEHQFVGPTGFSRQRRARFDAHTAGHCVELDRVFYARGMWSAIPPRAVILRGGVFELARCNYYRKFPDPAPGDLFEHISRQFHFREFHPDSSAHFEGIAEWTDWVARTPCPGLDWRDRFYLEQRLGGWESSIEQALDLTTYDRLYPANSHLYISTALALAEEVRRSGRHHVDLIRRMAPELLRPPTNPRDDLPVRLWSGARNEWQQFSARRRKAGYAVYVARRGFRMAKRLVKRAD